MRFPARSVTGVTAAQLADFDLDLLGYLARHETDGCGRTTNPVSYPANTRIHRLSSSSGGLVLSVSE